MRKTNLETVYHELMQRSRPTTLEYGLLQAMVAAARSTCSRAKNGAVITAGGRVISSGYNGALAGQEHCNHACDCIPDTITNMDTSVKRIEHEQSCARQLPCTRSVHAEHNAILWAARQGVKTYDATMFTTMQPCQKCAEAIVQSGISHVYYLLPYRDSSGLYTLRDSGVIVVGYGAQTEHARPTDVL